MTSITFQKIKQVNLKQLSFGKFHGNTVANSLKEHFPSAGIDQCIKVSENAIGYEKWSVGRHNYYLNPFCSDREVYGTSSIHCAIVPKTKADMAW